MQSGIQCNPIQLFNVFFLFNFCFVEDIMNVLLSSTNSQLKEIAIVGLEQNIIKAVENINQASSCCY